MHRHEHCDKCYNIDCQVPVQISVSCAIVKCDKNCGAIFHMCKKEEHQLLCPNEMVPCFNVINGCPLTMPRHRLAQHLQFCPASMVCCSQEWIRWPVSETELTFYKKISESPLTEVNLDVSLALRDQELLFQSIKMKDVFPELIAEDSALQDVSARASSAAEKARCALVWGEFKENGCMRTEGKEQSQKERDVLAKSKDVAGIQRHNSWEKIFKENMDACEQPRNLSKSQERGREREKQETANCQGETRVSHLSQGSAAAVTNTTGATGFAPWNDGVLERLSKEANIAEYNMYLAHNGAMLINFGQLAACTPREKDFVYGNLEPIEVKSVHTFNIPTSYRAKRHYLRDPARKPVSRHQGVGTAELQEDLPMIDEVEATLLCCLEKELKGHLISETVGLDGLYVSTGTQTYNFASAPFKADASLADVIADTHHGLYVNIETESVTRRHNKTSSAFSYMCGRFFRRDEFCWHFRNVHSDIQASLSGWFQQRCPLAYLGCTFNQTRFQPAGHTGTVTFCQDAGALVLQPDTPLSTGERGGPFSSQRNTEHNQDPLSRLPLEILQHIAGYLDSLTLAQLSQVSPLMREMCATLLQERGMVSLKWERKTYSQGGSSWKCRKKVWEFSSLFSPVDRWSFRNTPSVSDHLKTCFFYQKEMRTGPVALVCLGEVQPQKERANHQK
ncbi:F-box only protein 40-like [Brachionichthys hirsutus]|uniref:F-box only protein 40-like n=1 Tax=Brachionichthys hirsutus TaxID=412623 RepID=UPI003604B039